MDKYVGFDIDSNKTSVCIVQKNKADGYATIGPDERSMRNFLGDEKKDGSRVHVTF